MNRGNIIKKLYEKRNYSESTYNFFKNHELPQLKEQEKQKCEGLLTEKECEEAVKYEKRENSRVRWFDSRILQDILARS